VCSRADWAALGGAAGDASGFAMPPADQPADPVFAALAIGCADAANPPHRLHLRGVPPVLIVNATHDASTTYRWALSVSAQIRGSAVLTRRGDGHTSYFSSACARAATDRNLIEARVPPPGQVCT
jgi:hypothetical protein